METNQQNSGHFEVDPRPMPTEKKKAMNLCLLQVPGTHLFSIGAFKALKKTNTFSDRKKNPLEFQVACLDHSPSVRAGFVFSICGLKLASHDWIIFEISPKTHPKTQKLQRRASPRYQGRRNSRHTSSTPWGRRAAFEPALLRGIIAPMIHMISKIISIGMVSFAKKIIRLVVEYLKLPQVLGQNLLKLGAKSDAIELKWPDL